MKRNYKTILAVLLLVGVFLGFKNHQNQESKEQATLFAVHRVLDYAHYKPQKLDNQFSEKVFGEFIKNLDPSKRFLLQSDIDSLSKYKYLIDDEINSLQMDLFKKAYNIVLKRQRKSFDYVNEILSEPFQLHIDETMNLDYEHISFAKTEKELKNRWRKYLKSSVLSKIYDKQKDAKKKKDSSFVSKSLTDLEKEARKDTKKIMKNFKEAMRDMEEVDYFSMFLNAITMQYDPHTNYFSPEGKDRFDISMSGSFEGIGARLQKDGDYVKIIEIIPGGPAAKDGVLKVGDLITKVGQGNEAPVDIIGMSLSKTVKLIKGKKGTVVKLFVKRMDGTGKVIPITRDKVELAETFAKSLIIDNKKGEKFGYIYLPKFYINFKDNEQRSAASDIKKELKKLKKEKVQGIILDLRNNGGGSLSTVVDIGGFFIDYGPIVQVKDKKEKVEILDDRDAHIIYDGNLIVLVNELSASASEILAAALQDYDRAIIIGSKTYGKGTVQNFISLNRVGGNKYGDLGALKWTTKKFYRVTGASTQRKGVTPDILVPDRYSHLKVREENEKTALKWDKISSSNFKKWYNLSEKENIIREEQERVNHDSIFINIDKQAQWLANRKNDYTLYLDFDKYKADIEKTEKENKKFDSLIKFQTQYSIQSLDQDIIGKENDTIFKSKREKWIKQLEKDVYLNEALRVLEKM